MNFEETQKFRQWWLWTLLLVPTVYAFYDIFQKHGQNILFDIKPAVDSELIIFLVVMFGILLLFGILRLETKIDRSGIKMKYFPFYSKNTDWKDISTLQIIKYGFVGYGIRFGSKHGTVYNTNGNIGLKVILKSGKSFVIGTQKKEELNALIKSAKTLNLID